MLPNIWRMLFRNNGDGDRLLTNIIPFDEKRINTTVPIRGGNTLDVNPTLTVDNATINAPGVITIASPGDTTSTDKALTPGNMTDWVESYVPGYVTPYMENYFNTIIKAYVDAAVAARGGSIGYADFGDPTEIIVPRGQFDLNDSTGASWPKGYILPFDAWVIGSGGGFVDNTGAYPGRSLHHTLCIPNIVQTIPYNNAINYYLPYILTGKGPDVRGNSPTPYESYYGDYTVDRPMYPLAKGTPLTAYGTTSGNWYQFWGNVKTILYPMK